MVVEALGTLEATAINEDKAFIINRISSADTINPDDKKKAIRLIRSLIRSMILIGNVTLSPPGPSSSHTISSSIMRSPPE